MSKALPVMVCDARDLDQPAKHCPEGKYFIFIFLIINRQSLFLCNLYICTNEICLTSATASNKFFNTNFVNLCFIFMHGYYHYYYMALGGVEAYFL